MSDPVVNQDLEETARLLELFKLSKHVLGDIDLELTVDGVHIAHLAPGGFIENKQTKSLRLAMGDGVSTSEALQRLWDKLTTEDTVFHKSLFAEDHEGVFFQVQKKAVFRYPDDVVDMSPGQRSDARHDFDKKAHVRKSPYSHRSVIKKFKNHNINAQFDRNRLI